MRLCCVCVEAWGPGSGHAVVTATMMQTVTMQLFFQQCHHWERLGSVQESPLQVHLRNASSECLTLSCPCGWWGEVGEGGREGGPLFAVVAMPLLRHT